MSKQRPACTPRRRRPAFERLVATASIVSGEAPVNGRSGAGSALARCAEVCAASARQLARLRIAAVPRAVDERPNHAARLRLRRLRAEQPRADPEQDVAREPRRHPPDLRPTGTARAAAASILEPRQLAARLLPRGISVAATACKPRLGGGAMPIVEFVEPLAPPSQPDRAELRLAARRHDIGEGKIEIPQRTQCRAERRAGAASSATSRSRSSVRSAIGDRFHRLDHLAALISASFSRLAA